MTLRCVLLVVVCFFEYVTAGDLRSDCAALEATGWGARASVNWAMPFHAPHWCCDASGITCSNSTGVYRVSELNLPHQGLTGSPT